MVFIMRKLPSDDKSSMHGMISLMKILHVLKTGKNLMKQAKHYTSLTFWLLWYALLSYQTDLEIQINNHIRR